MFYERTDRKCRKIDQFWHFSVYNFLCKHQIGKFSEQKLFISSSCIVWYKCWLDSIPLSDFRIFQYVIYCSVNNAHPSSGISIFGFPTLDYIAWTHFQENNFGAVPPILSIFIEWLIRIFTFSLFVPFHRLFSLSRLRITEVGGTKGGGIKTKRREMNAMREMGLYFHFQTYIFLI